MGLYKCGMHTAQIESMYVGRSPREQQIDHQPDWPRLECCVARQIQRHE